MITRLGLVILCQFKNGQVYGFGDWTSLRRTLKEVSGRLVGLCKPRCTSTRKPPSASRLSSASEIPAKATQGTLPPLPQQHPSPPFFSDGHGKCRCRKLVAWCALERNQAPHLLVALVGPTLGSHEKEPWSECLWVWIASGASGSCRAM